MKRRLIILFFALCLLFTVLPVSVLAATTSIFCCGSVTVNCAAAPIGTIIEIFIGADATPSGSGVVTTNGQYSSIQVKADPSRYGEPLKYKVNGFVANKLGPDAGVFGLANQEVNLGATLGLGQSFSGVPRSCDSAPCCVTFTNFVTGGTLPYKHSTWDFGDGTQPVRDEAIQYGQQVTHCYQKVGVFDVTLTMEDAESVVAYEIEFDFIMVGGVIPFDNATWSFEDPGFFPKHLPDSFFREVWLDDLVDVPTKVQAVYWWDGGADVWKFWGPGIPGTTLDHLSGGLYADYMVSVTGACSWDIPLPRGL